MLLFIILFFFFFSSRRRHTRYWRDWSSDVCSSDLPYAQRLEYIKDTKQAKRPEHIPMPMNTIGHCQQRNPYADHFIYHHARRVFTPIRLQFVCRPNAGKSKCCGKKKGKPPKEGVRKRMIEYYPNDGSQQRPGRTGRNRRKAGAEACTYKNW